MEDYSFFWQISNLPLWTVLIKRSKKGKYVFAKNRLIHWPKQNINKERHLLPPSRKKMDAKVLFMESEARRAVAAAGKSALTECAVGVLTLAGGVGSRLGFSGPKGAFEIDTSRGKRSLFEMQAEKVGILPWAILVSPKTKEATISHLKSQVFQSTQRKSVYLIEQEEVEALSLAGEVLLQGDGAPVRMPNGNGSVFRAVHSSPVFQLTEGALAQVPGSLIQVLESQGVQSLNIVSVDNVLVRIADPLMLGWLAQASLEVVSAAVPIPEGAQMGVFVQEGGSATICEYIDQPQGAALRNKQGVTLGNIANHLVSLSFLGTMNHGLLKYHEAIKKIPHAKEEHPTTPNGIKRELFIFDGFNLSKHHGVVEYSSNAYEGLKNKEGPRDSVASCTQALLSGNGEIQGAGRE
ncbi:UDP-N-acetylglucosamine/UDP-N-acetylgalactosamine diphosphorylase [Nematocida displodere]|uniref:UDP-N-acetylglucosamine diphosphorylase n=1 Tax=Nematocida displodere TaxID=1805483 RepID=A0A177EH97_9MICR|nr:UDP-N-acetylglucosamine/UDP-N-acetylgalactosamine diphosphorylase [Nematocida displodere]